MYAFVYLTLDHMTTTRLTVSISASIAVSVCSHQCCFQQQQLFTMKKDEDFHCVQTAQHQTEAELEREWLLDLLAILAFVNIINTAYMLGLCPTFPGQPQVANLRCSVSDIMVKAWTTEPWMAGLVPAGDLPSPAFPVCLHTAYPIKEPTSQLKGTLYYLWKNFTLRVI